MSRTLVSIAGPPLAGPRDIQVEYLQSNWGALGLGLSGLLSKKNGFYAFEQSLLVRPFARSDPPLGILQWNEHELWKKDYDFNLKEVLFFAEDIFGAQFGIARQAICEFDPETAELRTLADSVESWCEEVYQNYRVRTGYPIAHEWQLANGALQFGRRLLPKLPFVLGGEFRLANLYPISDVEGMQFRASLANQLRDVPDGSRVIIRVKESTDGT